MSVFTVDYAAIYDLLYGGKDYGDETVFVLDRLVAHASKPSTLLEVGCGTGGHAEYAAGKGVTVQGVDLSEQMVIQAQERRATLPPPLAERLQFTIGDMRSLDLGRTFDAAVSLFHVVSYLTEDTDLDRAFVAVRSHLAPGAPFLFDFWYGPAILRDGVERRERVVENDVWKVTRITEPVWEKDRDLVRVNFHITGIRKDDGSKRYWHEEHPMRYFHEAFLTDRLAEAGFRTVETGEWLTGNPPTADALGAYLVAVAV